ncbi:DEAD/DEAH box helicase [Candidatus Dojkabacteria bacterium]|jgi:transcription-repair coupling factor (superfamily II helicase)|nr:DEAD/DEAH box helicase [Candidatus Dojkabacteria bacterium]
MDEVIQKLAEVLDLSKYDSYKPWVVVGTGESNLNVACKVLSLKLNSGFSIEVVDDIEQLSKIKNDNSQVLKVGDVFDINILSSYGFSRVARVWQEGEYSILGDIITFWPKGNSNVVRISLIGNLIEEIAILDFNTRMLIEKKNEVYIFEINKSVRNIYNVDRGEGKRRAFFVRDLSDLENEKYEYIDLGIRSFPGVSLMHLESILKNYLTTGYAIYSLSTKDDFESKYITKRIAGEINRGFVSSKAKIMVISDFEMYGDIDLGEYGEKDVKKGEEIFKQIAPGDYIVHADHGIGIYERVVEQFGVLYLDIHYAGSDRLLVPLNSANRISKYVGAKNNKPKLTGLSSGVWTRITRKVKDDVEKIAKELASLYAMRKLVTRESISANFDIKSFKDFVLSFQYQDTEDQAVITEEIVADLEKETPMDRLIVGDVGFGKTELSARAAYLCVNAGFQVALLAPTTVLTAQHFSVFKERFEKYPFRIEMLSRFITKHKREEILQDIESGKVDIVIGTHALLSDEVHFKDLGLLIIDEEQKFGVEQKEKIKKKKLSVNVLSTTATPIPRTLNMAMSKIRDLSILASVPSGRKSIINKIGKFDWETVVKSIKFEIKRGGQVYYLHNRVRDLERIKAELESRIENIKVGIGHGQLGEVALAKIMSDFSNGKFDLLLCSTIIENGLDIPNVNTLIVDDADRYGLSQLYQIRGRVGRSDVQAYAYIMFSKLIGDALLRLDALEEAHSLGSGFILSSRDLEIRGVGNILGKSQSGSINSVGYALYTQMLTSEIERLQDGSY